MVRLTAAALFFVLSSGAAFAQVQSGVQQTPSGVTPLQSGVAGSSASGIPQGPSATAPSATAGSAPVAGHAPAGAVGGAGNGAAIR